jgi:hypothetical protein
MHGETLKFMYIVLLLTYTNSTNITLGDITEHEENPGAKKDRS